MPFVSGFLRIKKRFDRWGRPVDPDYGLEEGGPDQGFNPDYPDQGFHPDYPDQGLPGRPGRPPRPGQGLPPSWSGRPGHLPARPGRPVDPGWGVDEGSAPGQGLPGGRPGRPEYPSHRPPWHKPEFEWPPGPTDPDWGIEAEGPSPEHPIFIEDVNKPDQGLPPVDGHRPPPNLPPGSIWPPLPEGAPEGKHAFLVWISGVGYRYGIFDVPKLPPEQPGQGLPPNRPPQPQPR